MSAKPDQVVEIYEQHLSFYVRQYSTTNNVKQQAHEIQITRNVNVDNRSTAPEPTQNNNMSSQGTGGY